MRILGALLRDPGVSAQADSCFQAGACTGALGGYTLGGYRVYDGELVFGGNASVAAEGLRVSYFSVGQIPNVSFDRIRSAVVAGPTLTASPNVIIADSTSYALLVEVLRREVQQLTDVLDQGYEVTFVAATPEVSLTAGPDQYRVSFRMRNKQGLGSYVSVLATHVGLGQFSGLTVL